jgi:putative ABC transport system permease protein
MHWFRRLLNRSALDHDLAEEIRQHLEQRTDELVASGVPRHEAALRARRAFGNTTSIEEQGRDVWRWMWVEDLLLDLRVAFRQLRRAPGFATAGALTLAIGIGATTTVFSVVNAVVFRALPFDHPERIVAVVPQNSQGPANGDAVSYPNFFDFRRETRAFEQLVSYRSENFAFTGTGGALQLRGEIVASGFFQALGVQPMLGRPFDDRDEEPAAHVVILSHAFWQTALGADSTIVGRTIDLNREPYVVIGVAPEGFNFPVGPPIEVWTTLALDARSSPTDPVTRQRGARMLSVVGRLREGVTLAQGEAQMASVAASLMQRFPSDTKRYPGVLLRPLLENITGQARDALLFLFGAVGLVMLLACANIANLLLSRTTERERELALRAAIGAGRWRIARQLLAENSALALVGCVAGVATSVLLLRLVVPLGGASIPRIDEARFDLPVLAFAIASTVVTSILVSVASMVRVARRQLHDPMKQASQANVHAWNRFRSGLVVAQIALGLLLTSGASLLTASYIRVSQRDPGFDVNHVLTFSVSPPTSSYDTPRRLAFYDQLTERLRGVPNVRAAAVGNPLPLTGSSVTVGFDIEGRPSPKGARPTANMAMVSPEFFETAGIPLLEGRGFTDRDDDKSPPVVIVNRAFAERFFPGENAVGKRMEPGIGTGPDGRRMRQIVGVVGDARQSALGIRDDAIYYIAYKQLPWCCPSVVVRAAHSPASIVTAIRPLVASIDKQLPVYQVRTGPEIESTAFAAPRFIVMLLGSFAMIGVVLTAIGLYGVTSYDVLKRTREIGMRMALGATKRSIASMVLGGAARLVVVGVALGLLGALTVGRLMRAMLFGVAPGNPVLIGTAVVIVVSTALVSAYLPARRAASVDPMLALRSD